MPSATSQQPSVSDRNEAVESMSQFASMWRRFVNECAGSDATDLPGASIRWADNPFAFWNLVLVTEQNCSLESLAAHLDGARRYMQTKSCVGFACVCEELLSPAALAALPDAVAANGLGFALTMHGMAGDFLPIPDPAHPDVELVRITDDAGLRDFADMNARAYGTPLDAVRPAIAGSTLWKQDMDTYVARENGEPVAAAATAANDGCLFLALVATIPEAQKRGIGEAVVRKALYEGVRSSGLTRTVLHATDAGFPVYQRIGYHKTATIHAYKLQG